MGEELSNALIVFIVSSKFPLETVAVCYQAYGKPDQIPKFGELEDLLEIRIQTLVSLKAKSLGHFKTSYNVVEQKELPKNCAACKGYHLLYQCETFRKFSLPDRWRMVQSNQLCPLCLNGHQGKSCTFKWTCQKCWQRHNTLLHGEKESAALNSTGDQSVAVFAKAAVTLISNCGFPFTFKALIDQG